MRNFKNKDLAAGLAALSLVAVGFSGLRAESSRKSPAIINPNAPKVLDKTGVDAGGCDLGIDGDEGRRIRPIGPCAPSSDRKKDLQQQQRIEGVAGGFSKKLQAAALPVNNADQAFDALASILGAGKTPVFASVEKTKKVAVEQPAPTKLPEKS